MELKDYWNIAKKWWWLAVACVLISSVSSYIGTLDMPRIYQATSTVMVGQALQKADPSSQDIWLSQQLAQTYAEMVKRRPIRSSAAEALGLQFTPSPGNISTRQVPGTQLLEISVRDTDPERARVLADEIANQLILQSPTMSQDQERQAFVQDRLAGIERNIQEAEAEIDEEQAKLEAANSARAIQQYQANITALQQKLSSYESTYASLLLTVQGGTNTISMFESATTPQNPISPNVPETVALAGAIGFALAVGGAVLIEFLDDTVKSPEEAVRLAGDAPMLAAIAQIEGKEYPDKLIASKQPLSPITEAFRVLRTNVQFSAIDQPLATILVTSPGPSEGKSVTLANLAVVLAQSGHKVIVVDTDLRRPVQHKLFQTSNSHGLSDAILNPDQPVMEYLQSTDIENLYLLTAGSPPPNPAELLASERALQLIETLQAQADVVLFDSPPVLVVTDAAVLGSRVDGVVLVNDLGNTRRSMARRAVEELERAHAHLLGLVLNRMAPKYGGEYYHQYYYYYYYREGERVKRHRPKKGPVGWVTGLFGADGNNGRENGNGRDGDRHGDGLEAPARLPESGRPREMD
jgi:non-specific protein-tyrosine kinase